MNLALAHRIYPLTEGIAYYEKDLETAKQIEELFDYCQILEASIFKEGWNYLINRFGYEELYNINLKSGWMEADTLEEFTQMINEELGNI